MANKSNKITTPNPTLHGLLIARSFNGTVVRALLFVLLTGAVFLLIGTAALASPEADNLGLSAVGIYIAIAATYLIFDVVYVVLANVRPLHPRLDRIILPLSLVFSILVIYVPLFAASLPSLLSGLWISGGIALGCVLVTRVALLIASTKR